MFHHGRRIWIEGIHPRRKREKERVALFKMFHVGDPFPGHVRISPFQVGRQVKKVGRREPLQGFVAISELVREVKNRPEKVGEAFVFKQVGILQKAQKKRPFFEQMEAEVAQAGKP